MDNTDNKNGIWCQKAYYVHETEQVLFKETMHKKSISGHQADIH